MIKIRRRNGIELYDTEAKKTIIRFDPKRTTTDSLNFISHAHSDHSPSASDVNAPVISDPLTLEVIKLRTKRDFPFKLVKDATEYECRMHSSGHVIGGKMLELKVNNKQYLYTGDFNPVSRLDLFEPAKAIKTDYLIIEGTYGNKDYTFPDPKQIFSDAYEFIDSHLRLKKNVLLQGYAFGKAQIIARFLEMTAFDYFVDHSIFKIHQLLEKYGYSFKGKLLQESSIKTPSEGVIAVSPFNKPINRYFETTVGFTGWAKDHKYHYQTGVDKAFPLSDHVDYQGLLDFIRACDPEKVFVFDGSSRNLAIEIKNHLKIPAFSLDDQLQILG